MTSPPPGLFSKNPAFKIAYLGCYAYLALSLAQFAIDHVAEYHAKRDAGIVSRDQLEVVGSGGPPDGHGDEDHH